LHRDFKCIAIKEKSIVSVGMKKLTDNFYCIECNKIWTPSQVVILKKNINYKLFSSISIPFINDTIYGVSMKDSNNKSLPKFIMFNFDTKNGDKHSLRGIMCVTINCEEIKRKSIKRYYTLDIICNSAVKSSSVKSVKKRHGIKTKNGKDMLEYWKQFGKSKFSYFKLKSMETVLGFYWKQGWRFNLNGKFETIWDKRIKELDTINKSIDSKKYYEKDKLRHVVLKKYFDRFLDGYYSDSDLSRNNAWDVDYNDYMINSTIDRERWDLRFHGYTMYWNCND
jgi:hypothetical protein